MRTRTAVAGAQKERQGPGRQSSQRRWSRSHTPPGYSAAGWPWGAGPWLTGVLRTPPTPTVRQRGQKTLPERLGPRCAGKAGRCWLLALHPVLCSRRRAQDVPRLPGTGFPGRPFAKAPPQGLALRLDVSTHPLHPWPPCRRASAQCACASLGAHCEPTGPSPSALVQGNGLWPPRPFPESGGPTSWVGLREEP